MKSWGTKFPRPLLIPLPYVMSKPEYNNTYCPSSFRQENLSWWAAKVLPILQQGLEEKNHYIK
jgi:hypothetical protein